MTGIASAVTNYEYENKIENAKRNIYLLKPQYVPIAIEDIEADIFYKRGSSQRTTDYLARAENIRLYS